jgi:hypothetical protein
MKMKHVLTAGLLSAGYGALALGLVATSAKAAPAVGLGGAVDATPADASLVQKAHWYGRSYGWGYGYNGYRPHYGGYYGGYGRYYRPFYRGYQPFGWRYGYGRYRGW